VVVQKQNPGILPDIAATKVRNQHAFTWVGYEKLSESHFHENARRRQQGLIENNVSIQTVFFAYGLKHDDGHSE
jgi:hypothetical protein